MQSGRLEKRTLSQKKKSRENELKEQGWIRQNTIGEPRLSECIELYESLGYDVHLEPVILGELDEECRKCYELEGKTVTVKTIYIRPKSRN